MENSERDFYAGMLADLDHRIGQLMAALIKAQVLRNDLTRTLQEMEKEG